MNRPSQKYTYLIDKYYNSNIRILKEFAKELLKELKNNPEGVQLPLGLIRFKRITPKFSSNQTLKNKYGEHYKMTNSHTGGDIITTEIIFKSHVTNKRFITPFINMFKFEGFKPIKRIQYLISHSNYTDYDY